jgi:virginiamycin B lyase
MLNMSRLGVLVGALFASMLPALAQELPEGEGKQAVAATCNTCHPLLARVGSGYTVEGWHTVMRMMVNQGAAVPADQAEAIMQYLIKTFPEKGKPVGVSVPGAVQVTFKSWQAPTPGSR